MVAKNDLMTAAEEIDKALQAFVLHRGEAKVLVFPDEWGHLHAVVATHGFEGMPEVERREQIRKHLEEHVRPESLSRLYHVHPMSSYEYDAAVIYSDIGEPIGVRMGRKDHE